MSIEVDEIMGPGFLIFFQTTETMVSHSKFDQPDAVNHLRNMRMMYDQNLAAVIRAVVETINAQS